jgi:cyclic dehypoxanthinyl futalosine synthase
VVDRNINYTNVCINQCKFCAFYRKENDPEAYLLSEMDIHKKIRETLALGGTQILIQGGLHPGLGIEYYEKLFSGIKKKFNINIHGLSPAEVKHISSVSELGLRNTLERLKASGLDSCSYAPDTVDSSWFGKPQKMAEDGRGYAACTELGMPTTATMMFGSIKREHS